MYLWTITLHQTLSPTHRLRTAFDNCIQLSKGAKVSSNKQSERPYMLWHCKQSQQRLPSEPCPQQHQGSHKNLFSWSLLSSAQVNMVGRTALDEVQSDGAFKKTPSVYRNRIAPEMSKQGATTSTW